MPTPAKRKPVRRSVHLNIDMAGQNGEAIEKEKEIPRSTAWHRSRGRKTVAQAAEDRSYLTKDEKKEMVGKVNQLILAGQPVPGSKLCILAFQIKSMRPDLDEQIHPPSRNWGYGFMHENRRFIVQKAVPDLVVTPLDAEDLCSRCVTIRRNLDKFLASRKCEARQLHTFIKIPIEASRISCKLCHFVRACLMSWGTGPVTKCYLFVHYMEHAFGSAVAGIRILLSLSAEHRYRKEAVHGWIIPRYLGDDNDDNDDIEENEVLHADLQPSFQAEKAKAWLDFCDNNHSVHCGLATDDRIPHLRLINTSTNDTSITWATPGSKYAALSYVWGDLIESLSERPEKLPKTAPLAVRDALKVARELGIPYLWVDRYCVDQDEKSSIKLEQLENMHRVYQSAYVTIIAGAGEDPSFGLPGVSVRQRKRQLFVDTHGFRLLAIPNVVHDINGCKWSTRGWVYQENLFSRRRLVFTETQMYFQCLSMNCCEAVPNLLEEAHTKNLQRFKSHLDTYMVFPRTSIGTTGSELVERIQPYLARDFGREKDALIAFLGIFQAFLEVKFPVYQFYGLPMSRSRWDQGKPLPESQTGENHLINMSFLSSLSWSDSACDQTQTHRLTRRHELPSWTWAGWKGLGAFYPQAITSELCTPSIAFHKLDSTSVPLREYREDFNSTSCMLLYEPAIYLEGWVTDVLLEDDGSQNGPLRVSQPIPTHRIHLTAELENPQEQLLETKAHHRVLLLGGSLFETSRGEEPLGLSDVHALVLQPVLRARRKGSYTRLGVVTWSLLGLPSFESSSRRKKMMFKELFEARRVSPSCGCGCESRKEALFDRYLEDDSYVMEFRREAVVLV